MEAQVTKALVDLILAVSAFVGAFLVSEIRKRFAQQAIYTAQNIARVVVNATEQITAAYGWDPKDKLEHALAAARDLGAQHGVKLTDVQWRSLIESEVADLKKFGAELVAPAPPTTDVPVEPTPADPVAVAAPEPVPTPAQSAAAALRAAADQLDASNPAPVSPPVVTPSASH